jgi:cytochrome c oxidase subunit 2
VPQLAGKTDLSPGQENTMWVEAESPGTYRGECAEYCGLQHSNMNLVVVAEPPESFEAWLAREAGAAATPNDSTSRVGEVVYRRECSRCHAIRGTDMLRDSAPDLTHIASRLTLGADLMNNVPGALAGWIENAPALKPGVLMPPRPLAGPELHALVTYLEGLR